MESVGVQEFSFWIAGIIGHPIIDIYKMQIVALPGNLFFDDLVGVADTVDDIPAGDAGFDGDEGQGNVAEVVTGMDYQLLEKNEQLFRVTAVAQVVVAGIDNDGIRVEGSDQAIEEPDACGQGRAAEAQVDGLERGKVLVQALPEPDGGTAVEEQFRIVGQCRSFFFEPLNFILVPNHMGYYLR